MFADTLPTATTEITTDEPEYVAMPSSGTHRYLIPDENLPGLQEEIDKLNKRAKRLKAEPVVLKVLGHEVKEKRTKAGSKYRQVYFQVELTGQSPRINGWAFIATLDHSDIQDDTTGQPLGVIIRKVPTVEVELPHEYRCYNPVCEHCGYKRHRSEVFVLQNEAGEFKRVGRQCLKDFLGYNNPHQLARMAEWLASVGELCEEAEGDGWGFGGGIRSLDMHRFLEYVAAEIRLHGYTSGRVARQFDKTSTASSCQRFTLALYDHRVKEDLARERVVIPEIEPADQSLAETALEWLRDLRHSEADLDDFMSNLTMIGASDRLILKNCGFAAYIIPAYQKHMEQEVKRREFEKRTGGLNLAQTSTYQGVVDQKGTWTLMLLEEPRNIGFGYDRFLVKFTDGTNALTWFSSRKPDMTVGKWYQFNAKVKNHESYVPKKAPAGTPATKTTILTNIRTYKEVERPAA